MFHGGNRSENKHAENKFHEGQNTQDKIQIKGMDTEDDDKLTHLCHVGTAK